MWGLVQATAACEYPSGRTVLSIYFPFRSVRHFRLRFRLHTCFVLATLATRCAIKTSSALCEGRLNVTNDVEFSFGWDGTLRALLK